MPSSAAAFLRLVPLLGLAMLACGAAPLSDADKLAKVEGLYEGYRQDFPGVPEMTVQEALALAAQGQVTFVDVRPPEERAVSTLPGAVTLEAVQAHAEAYRGKPLVGYCTISYRSGQAAKSLLALGLDYRNLRGGILAWTLRGGTVVDPAGTPVRRIHVYGRTWNYPPAGYEAIY